MATSYSLTRSPSTVTEGGQVTFTITRSGDTPAETIYFSTLADGTATYGEGDYTTTSGGQPANIAVSFSAGATTRTVTLNIIDDGVSDSGEQFRAIIQRNSSDPVSTYLDRSSYVTINDAGQNTDYEVTASPSTVTEGGQVTFTITRSGDTPAETIYFSTLADGTATYNEGDYTTSSGGQPANIAVSFSAGATTRTVTLNIIDDGVSDSGEQFRAIVQRDSSDPVGTYLDRSSYVTINDAGQNTDYEVTASPSTVTEGGQVTFTITRSGDTPAETIYFSTLADGTATYNEGDYTTTSGGQPANIGVTFGAGETSRTVTLNIVNDGQSDSGEQFRAIVQRNSSDPVGTYLDRSDFVTINDAGAQATSYDLSASPSIVTEGGQVTFTITRSGGTPAETIYFSTLADGTATYGDGDYETTSGGMPLNIAVNFGAGELTQTVTLNINDDGVSDANEQFRAIIQRNSTDLASTYLDRSDFVTISETAQGTSYELTPASTAVNEDGQLVFTITRTGDKPAETLYFSTLTDGAATYGEGDYATTAGAAPANIAVAFGAGETSKTVTLNILDDGQSDDGEYFRAIVQRDPDDAASVYLDRSDYVTIHDPAPTSQPSDPDWLSELLGFVTFANVAQAEENSSTSFAGFRYAVTEFGVVTETRGDADGWHIDQDLGSRFNPGVSSDPTYHLGEDWNQALDADDGQSVFAIFGGDVVYTSENHPGFGKVVVIKHTLDDGIFYSLYAHLDSFSVGATIDAGDPIGFIGSTGASNNHLHTEVFSVAEGHSLNEYMENGLPDDEGHGHWGYAHGAQALAAFGENAGDITNFDSYTEDGFTWYNPSKFIEQHPDELVVTTDDNSTTIDIGAQDSNAFLRVLEGAKEFLLSWFNSIRVVGGSEVDTLNIGSLFGTTIENHTVYFDGGAGADVLDATAADRRVVAEGGVGDDTLTGGAGDDRLDGGEDADFLTGGAGIDSMIGGKGDDTFVVTNAGDTTLESVAGGTDTVYASVSWQLASNVERLVLTGAGAIDGLGNGLANTIYGNNSNNVLDGGGGADRMTGYQGADTYVVDNPNDIVVEAANAGVDTVRSSISVVLSANVERLVLTGGGSINGTGNNLANTMYGNGGANILNGGAGADKMTGGAGNDMYYVDDLGDVTTEGVGAGIDTVVAARSWAVASNIEKVLLQGAGDFSAAGNGLANTLRGNSGDNWLNGSFGKDTLTGGGGRDSFIFNRALGPNNIDTITDYDVVRDVIRIDNAVFAGIGAAGALTAGMFNTGAAATQADDRIIYDQATGKLFFDIDGLGGAEQVHFATLSTKPAGMTASEFIVI